MTTQPNLVERGIRRSLMPWRTLVLLLACVAIFSHPVQAQVDDDEARPTRGDDVDDEPEAVNVPESEPESTESHEAFMKDGKPHFTVESITPSHGPISGDTRVTVRGTGFAEYAASFPEPKCRFGSDQLIVGAAYVSCPRKAPKPYERERRSQRTDTCVQCENSPATQESKPVVFTVSLTGDFSDASSPKEFYYYKPVRVSAIKPHQGPKDGDTTVHVWGENFVDLGDDTTCSFGSRMVQA